MFPKETKAPRKLILSLGSQLLFLTHWEMKAGACAESMVNFTPGVKLIFQPLKF